MHLTDGPKVKTLLPMQGGAQVLYWVGQTRSYVPAVWAKILKNKKRENVDWEIAFLIEKVYHL